MKGWLPVLCLVISSATAVGCGGPSRTARDSARQLACGARSYLVEGDLERAEQCLEQALTGGAPTAAAAFLLGDLLDATGRPEQALERYFEALRIAQSRGESDAEAEAAAMAVVAIRDRVEGFSGRFSELLDRLDDAPGRLPPRAWFQLRNLALGLALRSDDGDRDDLAWRTGCLPRWQVAGPFGNRVWEDFDASHELEAGGPWPSAVDLGPGRGSSSVRLSGMNVPCAVSLADRRLSFEGVGYARTVVPLADARTVWFRLETGGAARVRIGGEEVFRRDPRSGWPPIASWFTAELPAGNSEIIVTVADTASTPSFSLHALDSHGKPLPRHAHPRLSPTGAPGTNVPVAPLPDDRVSLHARLRAALWHEDRDRTELLLADLTDGLAQPAPIHSLAAAEAATTDPALPGEVSYERARALMQRTLEIEPRLWRARRFLARHEAMEGRPHEAHTLLADGIESTPEEPELYDELADLAAGAGWRSESVAAADGLARLLPTACRTLAWRLTLARQQSDFAAAHAVALELHRCNAGSVALAEELTREQRFEEALEEYRRLAERQEDSSAAQLDVARSAVAAGEAEAAVAALEQALGETPDSVHARTTLADALLANGRRDEAIAVLEQGLTELPGPNPALAQLLAAIDGVPIYDELRLDGARIVELYREQDPNYDTAAVWVLDRAVNLIGRDGSRVEVIHSIVHLKTDEALEEHGEFSIPAGALLLTARTIKQSGPVLEPEGIAGKPSISFPDLTPGDYIEIEYVAFHPGSPLFPGGFDTGRFYFQDFETAFHRSEILVIAPAEMPVETDPRGPCPRKTERRYGDLRTFTWRARGLLPHAQEPLAPVAREYLPSIRVTSTADWESLVSRIRDMLGDLGRPSPQLLETAEAALLGVPQEDHTARRRALYRWVMEHVEESGDLFEQASHIAVRRTGSRARLFAALLEAAGYSSRLALVRASGEDDTASAVPSLAIIERVVLDVEGDGWVSLEQDEAPYGYLPPDLRERPALYVDDGKRETTDGGTVPWDSQRLRLDIDLRSDGSARAVVTEELNGVLAAGWRADLREIPGAEIEKRFEESYLGTSIPGAALESLRIDGLEDPETPLVLTYEVEVSRLGTRREQALALAVPFPITLVKRVGGLPVRSTPAVLASRIEKSVEAVIALPEGFGARVREPDGRVESEWGFAEREIRVEGLEVRASYSARLEADRIAPEEYVEFLEFARKLDRLTALELEVAPEGD